MASYSLPRPSTNQTPSLRFRDKPYDVSKLEKSQKFTNHVSRVCELIAQRHTNFDGLNMLVKLSFGDGTQEQPLHSIIIDSRSKKAIVLEMLPEKVQPDLETTILPEFVLDVMEGRLNPQQAFRLYARPPCPGAFASRFSALGPPSPIISSDELNVESLPKPCEDIQQIKSDLIKWGYAFVANALTAEEVKVIKTALEEQAAGERQAGIAHMANLHKSADDKPDQRVWNLVNKGDEFLDLLNHPLIDAIMPWFLGREFGLFAMTATIVSPRSKSGIYMHTDQMDMTPNTTNHPYLLNIFWNLTDITDEKGATRIYPGSHIKNVVPHHIRDVGGSIPAAAPAGSCLLLDSRTWHSTGINKTSSSRPVICLTCCRFYVQRMEKHDLFLSEETKEKLSNRQRVLLGLPLKQTSNGADKQGWGSIYKLGGIDAGRMRVAV
ncbi:phytanoyl-dioxygenase [Colletotrichum truncatum]|uniref:Phytanoyl-dioxygenase n=1 Tax=Colletotrichum truncatum TaxID=5467 RepID=A0ACC3Z2P3_COLTU|nr:phytanoyl-dioxygenase [Colletotrichum truncatum]XP_036579068.1 phytanoyl-dioxygenase [Colletotrichum truncatum]KAF6780831.1 phytanoyl-dioxygenase [Colletotrichum truncatum]KAF6786499.1 phytanoyl-dioxygenase [Colletotrichum truncatum]